MMQSQNLTIWIKGGDKEFSIAVLLYHFTQNTNIPQNKLKHVMRELIIFSFKNGEKQVIAVTKFSATGPDDKNIEASTWGVL